MDPEHSTSRLANNLSDPTEWNIGEWGLDEWSGLASRVAVIRAPLSHSGEVVQVGARVTINGAEVAFSNTHLTYKIGKLAA